LARSLVPAEDLEDRLDELMEALQHAIEVFESGAVGALPRALLAVNRAAFDLALAAEAQPLGEASGWDGRRRRSPLAVAASIAASSASLASLALGHHQFTAPAPASKLS